MSPLLQCYAIDKVYKVLKGFGNQVDQKEFCWKSLHPKNLSLNHQVLKRLFVFSTNKCILFIYSDYNPFMFFIMLNIYLVDSHSSSNK